MTNCEAKFATHVKRAADELTRLIANPDNDYRKDELNAWFDQLIDIMQGLKPVSWRRLFEGDLPDCLTIAHTEDHLPISLASHESPIAYAIKRLEDTLNRGSRLEDTVMWNLDHTATVPTYHIEVDHMTYVTLPKLFITHHAYPDKRVVIDIETTQRSDGENPNKLYRFDFKISIESMPILFADNKPMICASQHGEYTKCSRNCMLCPCAEGFNREAGRVIDISENEPRQPGKAYAAGKKDGGKN